MRACALPVSFLSLVALARAGGSIDNSAEYDWVHSNALQLDGDGAYQITNVNTGKHLSFQRDQSAGLTNFFPSFAVARTDFQFNNEGQARISGGNNKCLSAQWSYDVEGGVDFAGVSYACTVGKGLLTGTDTLEKTKQWWYLVPADSSTGADDDDDDDSGLKLGIGLSLASKKGLAKADDNDSDARKSDAEDDADKSESTDSDSNNNKVIKGDRTTWVCRHPGWWLVRHPEYVTTGGHVECKDELEAERAKQSRRMTKRHRHSAAAATRIEKRAPRRKYWIIAVDHLHDMKTRALSSAPVDSFGGYTSTTLSLWDKSDDHQLWYIY